MTDLATDTLPGRDTARDELLGVAEEALHRLAPDLPPDAARLLHALHGGVPTAELATLPAEAVAGAAASLFAFARERPPGTARVRLLPPGPAQGPHAVAEIVTDDMPFLVDSALGALARHGRVVRQLLHPVLPGRRDAEGRLLALDWLGAPHKSLMRIPLGGGRGAMLPGRVAGEGAAREAALPRAMADPRLAVADF